MCYRPLHIINPTHTWNITQPTHIDVPCGKCYQCRNRKRNDWFVRSFYEHQKSESLGGSDLFVTLTYNDKNIPSYHGVKLFSKRHVQLFMKRLRRYFNCTNDREIKYLITSEYGGLTHRPHYHGVLHFEFPVNENTIKHAVKVCWSYGFVNFGKAGKLLKGISGIKYVTKYITKDIDFENEMSDLFDKRYFYDVDELKEVLKDGAPFHLQSHHYGEYILEKEGLLTDVSKLVLNTLAIPDTKKMVKSYLIPQYIVRKSLYDYFYDKDTKKASYKLSELGCIVRSQQTLNNIEETSENYRNLYKSVDKILDNENRIQTFNRIANTNFNNSADIVSFIEDSMKDFTFVKLAIYSNVFYCRYYLPLGADFYTDFEPSSVINDPAKLKELVEYRFVQNYKFQRESKRETYSPFSKKQRAMIASCYAPYSYDFLFKDYDHLISIFNALNYVYGEILQREADTCDKLSAMSRKLFDPDDPMRSHLNVLACYSPTHLKKPLK